jgi:hypothetical protein
VSPILEAHFARLKVRHPNATLTALPSGAGLIDVPSRRLCDGWSAQEVTVRLIAPNGYPVAAPDCFWVDPNLTFGNQQMPKNSAINNIIPETKIAAHWFSWHVLQGRWSASMHDLLTWFGLCEERLQKVE